MGASELLEGRWCGERGSTLLSWCPHRCRSPILSPGLPVFGTALAMGNDEESERRSGRSCCSEIRPVVHAAYNTQKAAGTMIAPFVDE